MMDQLLCFAVALLNGHFVNPVLLPVAPFEMGERRRLAQRPFNDEGGSVCLALRPIVLVDDLVWRDGSCCSVGRVGGLLSGSKVQSSPTVGCLSGWRWRFLSNFS